MIIGHFRRSRSGGWEGDIRTMTLDVHLRLKPNDDRTSPVAPTFRAMVGWVPCGRCMGDANALTAVPPNGSGGSRRPPLPCIDFDGALARRGWRNGSHGLAPTSAAPARHEPGLPPAYPVAGWVLSPNCGFRDPSTDNHPGRSWNRSSRGVMTQAEIDQLLDIMQAECEESGDENERPSLITFQTDDWIKSELPHCCTAIWRGIRYRGVRITVSRERETRDARRGSGLWARPRPPAKASPILNR